MTLAYVECEDRVVDVEQMLREFDAMEPISMEEGFRAAEAINKELIEQGIPEMTMEEIDEEIAKCRRERRERQQLATRRCEVEYPAFASVAR